MIYFYSSYFVGCQGEVNFVLSWGQRRDKPPCCLASLGSLNCLKCSAAAWRSMLFLMGPQIDGDNSYCWSSIPTIRGSSEGELRRGWTLLESRKMVSNPSLSFFPGWTMSHYLLIIIDPWNSQGIIFRYGILECKNPTEALLESYNRGEESQFRIKQRCLPIIPSHSLPNHLLHYFTLQVGIGFEWML